MTETQKQKGGKVDAEEDAGAEARDSTEKRGRGRPKKIEKSKAKEVETIKKFLEKEKTAEKKEDVKKGWELSRTPIKKIKDQETDKAGSSGDNATEEEQKRAVEAEGERQYNEEEEKQTCKE